MAGEHSSCVPIPVQCCYPGPQRETEQQVELKDEENVPLGRERMELQVANSAEIVRGICPIKKKPRALRKTPQRQDPPHSHLQLVNMKMYLKGENLN